MVNLSICTGWFAGQIWGDCGDIVTDFFDLFFASGRDHVAGDGLGCEHAGA